MFKRIMLIGCLAASVSAVVGTGTATAAPVPYDGFITMAAGVTGKTNDVPLGAGSYDIESIVFFNSGAVTAAVAVALSDIGVYTSMASFALSASGGSCQWPRRTEIYHTTTNAYHYYARELRVVSNKPTNAEDVVIFYRIKFAD